MINRVTSKYYVEKSSMMFARKKRIFIICHDHILLTSPNINSENQELVEFENIREVKVSDKNERDFTIITMKSKSHDFSCNERSRLLTELHFQLQTFYERTGSDNCYKERVKQQLDLYDEKSTVDASLNIFRTLVRVLYPRQKPKEGNGGSGPGSEEEEEEKGNVFGIEPYQKVRMLERKYDEEEETTPPTSILLYFCEIEQILRDHLTAYVIKKVRRSLPTNPSRTRIS